MITTSWYSIKNIVHWVRPPMKGPIKVRNFKSCNTMRILPLILIENSFFKRNKDSPYIY